MAAALSRRLFASAGSTFRNAFAASRASAAPFCSSADYPELDSDAESTGIPDDSTQSQQRFMGDRTLENGIDLGIYKAILVGQLGQAPIQKRLRSGKTVTLISLGTGGIRNNRRPLDSEDPKEYANRCAVQWHRVSVYPEKLGELAAKNLEAGSILYVEGNLETKIFNDPITGLVRRIREVSVRRNGRILLLANAAHHVAEQFNRADVSGVGGVGYF